MLRGETVSVRAVTEGRRTAYFNRESLKSSFIAMAKKKKKAAKKKKKQ